jgi:8-amino-7-oxononanoate synthase
MDGDIAPLPELVALCERYGAYLLLDEAHSTGIYGTGGNGLACALGLENRIFARVYTFGKAMGGHGACVVGSSGLMQYLVNFARPFIYTTAPPLHAYTAIQAAFTYLAAHPELPRQLFDRVAAYERALQSTANQSPIQVLHTPGNAACKALAERLVADGFEIRPILSPTVPAGKERLRICLHQFNTEDEIARLISLIRAYQA